MACCPDTYTLCAPDGTAVLVIADLEAGTSTYREAVSLAPWTGDPATLGACVEDTSECFRTVAEFTAAHPNCDIAEAPPVYKNADGRAVSTPNTDDYSVSNGYTFGANVTGPFPQGAPNVELDLTGIAVAEICNESCDKEMCYTFKASFSHVELLNAAGQEIVVSNYVRVNGGPWFWNYHTNSGSVSIFEPGIIDVSGNGTTWDNGVWGFPNLLPGECLLMESKLVYSYRGTNPATIYADGTGPSPKINNPEHNLLLEGHTCND